MIMAKPKITYFVDIVSPFAYIGFHALQNVPVFAQCEVTYVPILLGGLMKMCGNTPPVHIKNKDKWIEVERHRWAKQLRAPISKLPPPNFPVNTLNLQRVLVSISLSHPQFLSAAISLFYQNFWVNYDEPTRPENILAMVRAIIGDNEEARRVTERSSGTEVKQKLTENTELAYDQGAFGLPWYFATNSLGKTEGFWGVDHMGHLLDFLNLERPKDQAWRALL